jgi:hypothetical protein
VSIGVDVGDIQNALHQIEINPYMAIIETHLTAVRSATMQTEKNLSKMKHKRLTKTDSFRMG